MMIILIRSSEINTDVIYTVAVIIPITDKRAILTNLDKYVMLHIF